MIGQLVHEHGFHFGVFEPVVQFALIVQFEQRLTRLSVVLVRAKGISMVIAVDAHILLILFLRCHGAVSVVVMLAFIIHIELPLDVVAVDLASSLLTLGRFVAFAAEGS